MRSTIKQFIYADNYNRLPRAAGWHELGDKQLRNVYDPIAKEYATDDKETVSSVMNIQEFYADSLDQEFCRAVSNALNPDIMHRSITRKITRVRDNESLNGLSTKSYNASSG